MKEVDPIRDAGFSMIIRWAYRPTKRAAVGVSWLVRRIVGSS